MMEIKLNEKESIMLVEVPEDAKNFYFSQGDLMLSYNFGGRSDYENICIEDRQYPAILGTVSHGNVFEGNFTEEQKAIIKSETEKVYPYKTNPIFNESVAVFSKKDFDEAEKKVLPKKFAVLLIKK